MTSFRKVIPLSAILGIMVGLFGAGFYEVWHRLDDLVWGHLANPAHRIWVSGICGLAIGLIIERYWDPGTMADIILHFHHKGRLPLPDNKVITPISLIGLIGGSSAGPEGVLTQVCGSMGSWLADKWGQSSLVRILTQAGMGAGFGAFLGAPIGGAILWLEMPHKQGLEYYESLIPTLATSVVAYLVMAGLLHVNLVPTWHLSPFMPSTLLHLAIALGVGILAGAAAFLYSWVFRGVGLTFHYLRLRPWATTTLAGLLIGSLGTLFPLTYFYGRNELNKLVAGSFPLHILLLMLLVKMLSASITIRGHWQGGLIIPHMFMGAALGKAIAMAVPGIDPTLACLTAMAAFNAAATHTPLASALIVVALTGSGAVIPIFTASLVGFFIGQWVELIGNKSHRASLLTGYNQSEAPMPAYVADAATAAD